MTHLPHAGAIALALACAAAVAQQPADGGADATPASAPSDARPATHIGVVTITADRPTSLPTRIPTTMEGVTHEQIEQTVNATDAEDALKYFPSLLVRKRYIGDYNHAILSSRASGTGNSARSAVYADGILLSNFLGNGVGGLSFPPRWGLVTAEEIERVDVMYGPFSAAYPGNSVGAVVDYVTRMPSRLEAHAAVGLVVQPFDLYQVHDTYRSWQASAAVGSRSGDWAWWIDAGRTDSQGQPLTFATRLASTATPGGAGVPVTGAVAGTNNAGLPWLLLGAGTQYTTLQDHAKIKVAYDLTPTLRASYLLGLWTNESTGRSQSWLRDGAGVPVYGGPISVDGATFAQPLTGADFAITQERATHWMQGLSLKSHAGGTWDWEAAASLYDYDRDQKRQNAATNLQPAALEGGPGTLADGAGTGWNTLALKGIWRPGGAAGAHIVEFGAQQENYRLRYLTSAIAGDYLADDPGAPVSNVRGTTQLRSLYLQDAWRIAERWSTVLGLRAERWQAANGFTAFSADNAQAWPARRVTDLSPKAALSWQAGAGTVLKASIGRAVRMPTVAELYGATSTSNSQYINDPDLRPERSWTGELTAEQDVGRSGVARFTFFAEDTRDALYSQTVLDPVANKNITRVQNIGRIATQGLETAYTGSDVFIGGLDLSGSVTYARSLIKSNAGFVAVPGDTLGQWQPNIPRWRASALAAWRFDPRWSASVGARYSGRQYRTLDNSDIHGHAYQGVSSFLVADVRVRYQITRQWSAAFGIDNIGNDTYWNFHPYPQRSYDAELKWDL